MEQPNAVIEITDTEIRLAVGYTDEDKAHLIYITTRPINGLISGGNIVDFTTLTSILSSIREFRDESTKERLGVTEATVILPPLGLNIFQSQKTSNVVSQFSVIDSVDIENVIYLVQKEPVAAGNEIIDIIPDSFVLENNNIFTTPPLGQKSNRLTINAKIHTLPTRVVSEYKRVIESAHINVRRFCVSSYATSELAAHSKMIPNNYILVDMGSEVTSISLVGNHSTFGTVAFNEGGAKLVNNIAEKFGITNADALNLLMCNGYDTRKLTYKPIIARSGIEGNESTFSVDDLNAIVKDYFDNDFFPQFNVAFNNLMKDYPDKVKQLPIVFAGGFSRMYGFDELAKEAFKEHEAIHYLDTNTIGARSPKFAALVGGLFISGEYKGALSDVKSKQNGVKRENVK